MDVFRNRYRRDCAAATAVEYALIVSFVAIAIVGAVTLFGGGVQQLFTRPCAGLGGC